MARISENNYVVSNNSIDNHHDPVDKWTIKIQQDNGKLVQIDTFGGQNRKDKNTVSQSIQIDKTSARIIVDKLRRVFDIP